MDRITSHWLIFVLLAVGSGCAQIEQFGGQAVNRRASTVRHFETDVAADSARSPEEPESAMADEPPNESVNQRAETPQHGVGETNGVLKAAHNSVDDVSLTFAVPEHSGESSGQPLRLGQVPDPAPLREMVPVPTDPGTGLTLAVVEQMAIGNNPTLAQGQQLVAQAQGNWLQVGLYPNPVVGYTASEIGQEGQAGQQGAFVSQTIVRGNKLGLNRAVTSWDVERARWQLDAQQLRVLNDVRIRFYEALGAQQTVGIAEELQEIAAAGVKAAQERFKAQEVAQPDVLQAEIQLNQVLILRQNARYQAAAARQQLANVVGIADLPPQPLAAELDGGVAQLDEEMIWQQLLAVHPLLASARAQVERARAQVLRERVEPIPDLLTQFAVQYDDATDFTVANAQVGIALPVHNCNQGNISAAFAQLRRAEANVQRLELVLRDRLAETYRRYSIARTQVERYRESILPKAQKNLELTMAAYRGGELDFLRVLTARQTLFETRVEYIASLTDLRQSLVELDGLLLTGGLNDPADDAVNPGGAGGGAQPLTDTTKTE